MKGLLILLLSSILGLSHRPLISAEECSWTKRDQNPEVYWINMDRSKQRKIDMERHLETVGLRNYRVRGLTPSEIYIPPDIENTWRTAWCQLETEWKPPDKLSPSFNTSSEYINYSAYTAALCGRGKGRNTPKELGCTTSHLVAMKQAVYSTTAKSRYALIVEDDVFFPFDIDFDALAASAPKGFGILQLFNSNEGSMEATWLRYVNNDQYIWVKRHPMKYFDFWSTCAYLIDRVVMKPVVDAVIREVNGWVEFKVTAGINNPCVPKTCCEPGTDDFVLAPPCVWAPRGYQADSFLYAMTTTYMLSMPLISNGLGGNVSTFHQDHVELLHKKSFRRQRQYINQMLTQRVSSPAFAKPACTNGIDENMI